MKKLLFGAILLGLAFAVPVPTMADVSINIGIPLPPPIIFPAPPSVIVLPDAPDVYVDPDINADIYFWDGFWWRLWDGRWYRSPYYDRGWDFYSGVPTFYYDVDPGWRGFYRDHDWHGHPWNYQVIPYRTFHQNWRTWHNERHWRQGAWGVRGYRPAPRAQRQELRRQRQQQFQQRPEVQRNMQRGGGNPVPDRREAVNPRVKEDGNSNQGASAAVDRKEDLKERAARSAVEGSTRRENLKEGAVAKTARGTVTVSAKTVDGFNYYIAH